MMPVSQRGRVTRPADSVCAEKAGNIIDVDEADTPMPGQQVLIFLVSILEAIRV